MPKIKNILRCYAMGMGIKSISSAFEISRNTVRKYVRKYQESGLSLEKLLSMSEDHLQEMFVVGRPRGVKPSPRREALDALLPDYAKRLSRKGVTVKSLFEEFYGCAVFPARVRHPRDKALVENAVKLMFRSVHTDIEGRTFHDLESLNAAIRESLESFNNRKMSGRKRSRRELFNDLEAECLQPLPAARYQMKMRKTATVLGNSYVTLNKHHYSVPKEYVGKRVDIIYDAETLEIFHGLKFITTHHRDDTPYGYTQKDAHNLPGRHGSYEKDLDEVFQRAAAIDNIVLNYFKEVAAEKKYPPQDFRSCRGILSLESKYGLDRLVAACACATQARAYGYNEVKEILERGDDVDFMPSADGGPTGLDTTSPARHKNIRGRDYYSNQTTDKEKKNDYGNE